MDIVSSATRSRMMSGIRSSNTKPEITIRKFLHAQGFRYRLKTKIFNYIPDIALPKYKVAIFVHGCFWHRHPNCKYTTTPKSNVEKWKDKFVENECRDQRVERFLLESGWRVVVIWECWTKRDLDIEWLVSWITDRNDPYISWPEIGEQT